MYICRMKRIYINQIFYTILTKFYDSVKKLLKFWYCQLLCYSCACVCACATPIILNRPHHIKHTPSY